MEDSAAVDEVVVRARLRRAWARPSWMSVARDCLGLNWVRRSEILTRASLLAVGLAVALIGAGCSSTKSRTHAPSPSSTRPASSRSSLLTFHYESTLSSQAPNGGVEHRSTLEGLVDLGHRLLQQRAIVSSAAGTQPGMIDEIDDARQTYLRGTGVTGTARERWCVAGPGESSSGVVSPPFDAATRYLTDPHWQKVGTDAVDGVSTTHYRLQQAQGTLELWIDAANVLRKSYSTKVGATGYPTRAFMVTDSVTIRYFDIGAPVTITVPAHARNCAPTS